MSINSTEKINNEKKNKFGISSIIVIVLFILCIAYIFGSLNSLKNHRLFFVFGYSYSVVPTNSMEPNIHVNDVTLIKKVSYDELELEDVIVYYNDERNIFVVHRIKGYFDDGSFKTKGDNNPDYDTIHITEENYLGKVVASGSFLGLGKIINNGRVFIFVFLAGIFIFIIISEVINIYKVMKEKQEEEFKKEQLTKEQQKQIEREKLREEVIKELNEENKN